MDTNILNRQTQQASKFSDAASKRALGLLRRLTRLSGKSINAIGIEDQRQTGLGR
jgi:hypothetical protein